MSKLDEERKKIIEDRTINYAERVIIPLVKLFIANTIALSDFQKLFNFIKELLVINGKMDAEIEDLLPF